MIVIRFKATCQADKAEKAATLFADVVAASRGLDGVISFDVARDVTDPNSFVAVEVFEDEDAMQRQEQLPETQRAMGAFPDMLAAAPEATVYEVASAQAWAE